MWSYQKQFESLQLIDFGLDFFLINFQHQENYKKTPRGGLGMSVATFLQSGNDSHVYNPPKPPLVLLSYGLDYPNSLRNFMIFKSLLKLVM